MPISTIRSTRDDKNLKSDDYNNESHYGPPIRSKSIFKSESEIDQRQAGLGCTRIGGCFFRKGVTRQY